ncbi:MAG: riboflavin biosynthesis protein RibF [Victivallales bacterium]|nr:riboflavin biosynthesis protein RibF [Victivallales bacterium]
MIVPYPTDLPKDSDWAISLGVFDGVHLGHQAIFQELERLSKRLGARPAALFFSPNPKQIFHPNNAPQAICDPKQNLRLMQDAGLETFIRFPFTKELSALSPMQFLDKYFFAPQVPVKAFCVGENFRFGYNNTGDGNTLRECCAPYGIEVHIVPSVVLDGVTVSSTRIRKAVQDGDLELAHRMLGRPFAIEGNVSHGYHIGTTVLSCPTANLSVAEHLIPPYGVYAARGRLANGEAIDGIAYIGDAPTIRQDGPPEIILELHLFDFDGDLYDQPISIELYSFIRPSMKFDSPAALQRQISLDIEKTKAILK